MVRANRINTNNITLRIYYNFMLKKYMKNKKKNTDLSGLY